MIPVQNVYYMLSYAFKVLNEQGYKRIATEEFNNTAELMAAILAKGIAVQLKRGLGKEYISQTEDLSSLRGKIDIAESIKTQSMLRKKLICTYDDFSVNSTMNRIIKSTVELPVEAINNADEYAKVKEVLYKKYPFFDGNVLDAAKFLFGCDVSEVTWHEGWMSIMDDLSDGDLVMGAPEEDEEFDAPAHSGPILEGSRNKTLNHYAYRDLCFIVQTRIKAG